MGWSMSLGAALGKGNTPNLSYVLGPASRLLLEITTGLGRETKAKLQAYGLGEPQECWREKTWQIPGHTGFIQHIEAEFMAPKALPLVRWIRAVTWGLKAFASKSWLCCLPAMGLYGIN